MKASSSALLALALLGFFLGVFVSTLAGLVQMPAAGSPAIAVNSSSIQSVFSPGASIQIIREIDSANRSLDIMLYQFSFVDYQQALAAATARGVAVRIIFEPRVDSNFKTAELLRPHGVSVRWATRNYSNTHSKTMVVDGRRVLVGSINWSRNAAKTNRESGVIIDDSRIAEEFLAVFEQDWAKATPSNSTNSFPSSAANN